MENKPCIQVAFTDDHRGIRESLSTIMEMSGSFNVVIQTSSGEELLQKLEACERLPDVCIIDHNMPAGMSGAELLGEIRKRWLKLPVFMYSMYQDEYVARSMIKKGANGYLSKNSSVDELIEGLKSVHNLGYYYTDLSETDISKIVTNKDVKITEYNETEVEFLKYAAMNLSYKAIAIQMNISYGSVTGYRDRLFAKMNVKTRTEMILTAVHFAIIPIDL